MSRGIFLSIFLAPLVASALAQAADRPLATMVPDDVGLCVEVDDLSQRATQFRTSQLYARLEKFPPVAVWMAANAQPLEQLGVRIAQQLDLEPNELWDELFGNEALFGVWPGTGPDDSDGLLLVRASRADVLLRLLDGLDAVQKRADMVVEAKNLEHAGLPYRMRALSQGGQKQALYLATIGTLGVMTSRESIIKRVLELSAAGEEGRGSLADLPAYRTGTARLHPEAVVSLFVNPRRWDALMQAELKDDDKDDEMGEQFVKRAIIEGWKFSDYWVAGVTLSQPLLVETYVHFNEAEMPEPYRKGLASLGGKATFLERIPDDALVAYAGRINLGAIGKVFLDDSNRQNMVQMDSVRDIARGLLMGLDPFDDVLTNMGPDLGSYVVSRHPVGDDEVPLDLVFGVQIKRDEFGKAFDQALRSAMALAAEIQNGPEGGAASVETEKVDGIELTSIKGLDLLPAGVEATYSLANGYLYGGTSRDEVLRAVTFKGASSLATSQYLRPLLDDRIAEPGHVLYVNCRALREVLARHPDQLAGYFARVRDFDADTAKRVVDQIAAFAELAETVLIVAQVDEQGLAVNFRISTDALGPAAAIKIENTTTARREDKLVPIP